MGHERRTDLHSSLGGSFLYRGDVVLNEQDPTTYNVEDTGGQALALEERTVILVWNGTIQDPGTDFTLDAAGEVMTLSGAMDGSLYVLQARRKP